MSELSDLFQKDPLLCTEAELEKIIARYKEFRANPLAFKKTGERKKVHTKKVKTKQVDPNQIDLEELIKEMT
jgi:hypothetical protein